MARLLLISLFFLSQVLAPSFISVAKADIPKIKVNSIVHKNKTLVLAHQSFSDIKFRKRIYTEPTRFVFDILGAEMRTEKFSYDPPAGSDITSIRVAQFEPTIVRVVIESNKIASLEKIKIDNIGQKIYFKYGVDNNVLESYDFKEGDLHIVAREAIHTRVIKLEEPDRTVVDMIGMVLKSPSQKQAFTNGTDEQVKISQFDESTVRVVFTGKNSHKRKLKISEDEKQLLITGNEGKIDEDKELKDKILSIGLVKDSGNENLFLIDSTKKIEYKFLQLHDPERIVVDLVDIAFEASLEATQFTETKLVKDLRFGIAALGRPVTRLVFDLKETDLVEEFRTSSDGMQLYLKIKREAKKKPAIPPAVRSIGRKVVLDAGHGGYDPGALYDDYAEKDIVLLITKKVQAYLREAGIKAYMTRNEDRFISLAERVEISNSVNPAMFISIHVNALVTNPKMEGLQSYYYSSAGYKLASHLHKQLLKDVKMSDQRVRKASFWVCKYTKAPSTLLELGFMTSKDERKKLITDGYQDKLAKSVARGIVSYLEKNSR